MERGTDALSRYRFSVLKSQVHGSVTSLHYHFSVLKCRMGAWRGEGALYCAKALKWQNLEIGQGKPSQPPGP